MSWLRTSLLCAALLVPAQAIAAITVEASAKSSTVGADSTTSGFIDTTSNGINVLIVGYGWYSVGATPVLTDGGLHPSENWVHTTVRADGPHATKTRFSCLALSQTSAAHTVTATGAGSYIGLIVLAIAGGDDMCLGAQEGEGSNSGTTTFTFESITPNEDNTIVVAVFGWHSGTNEFLTDPGGIWTPAPGGMLGFSAGENFGAMMYYVIQTTAGATGTADITNLGIGGEGSIASFVQSNGGSPPAPSAGGRPLLLLLRP